MGVWGLGFRASGFDFRVSGLGFRVSGFGFGVWGGGFVGLGVWGLGFPGFFDVHWTGQTTILPVLGYTKVNQPSDHFGVRHASPSNHIHDPCMVSIMVRVQGLEFTI